jgi:hypothetical protein
MGLRFRRTAGDLDDWVLRCGGWVVGRILKPGGQRRDRFAWSLTGPATPAASVPAAGDAATLAEAKEQLVEAMRAWSVWAGVRQADGGGPVAPRWVLLKEHHPDHPMSATTCDPMTDWLLISGNFVAGRVQRPAGGPRHDPHWALLASGPMQGPGESAGWAESVEEAKGQLIAAWQAWLGWAELG